jgi:hypothetical protein
MHLAAHEACRDYLATTDEALRSGGLSAETSAAMRVGQQRVRELGRKHLLTWTREEARAHTQEAQLKVRYAEKIEAARQALEVIESTLRAHPDELELRESAAAIMEFIASVSVGRWVEMAERSAFKGHYGRAINRYRDALFYLSRETMNEETRGEMADRIGREIDLLRVRRKITRVTEAPFDTSIDDY